MIGTHTNRVQNEKNQVIVNGKYILMLLHPHNYINMDLHDNICFYRNFIFYIWFVRILLYTGQIKTIYKHSNPDNYFPLYAIKDIIVCTDLRNIITRHVLLFYMFFYMLFYMFFENNLSVTFGHFNIISWFLFIVFPDVAELRHGHLVIRKEL